MSKPYVPCLRRKGESIKRNLGLLQSGKASKDLSAAAAALSKVVEASWVTSHQKSVLQSLIQSQSQAEDTDEDLSFAPQATAASYSGHSDGIVDTLSDMEEKAESSLSSTR